MSAWVNGNYAIFSAGTDATGSFTVTPNSSVTTVSGITSRSGGGTQLVTIGSGSTITNTSGIVVVEGAGNRLSMQSVLTGTAGLIKRGAGILELNTSIPTYAGDTVVEEGVLRITQAGRIPAATSVNVWFGASLDIRGNNASTTIAGLEGAGAVRNGASSSNTTLILSAASGTKTFSGVLDLPAASGVLNVTKSGNYEQQLTGAVANTYTGNTTVTGGVLALGKTAGVDAIASGTLLISGGSVRLDASNQIANTVSVTLDGGTFDTNLAQSETVGALTLSSSSFLDMGTGAMALSFSDSSAIAWAGGTLSINNFILGQDTLRFGTNTGGLTLTQLAQLRFVGYGNVGGQIDASGYVVPVPEPATYVLCILAGAFLVLRVRRRSSFGLFR